MLTYWLAYEAALIVFAKIEGIKYRHTDRHRSGFLRLLSEPKR